MPASASAGSSRSAKHTRVPRRTARAPVSRVFSRICVRRLAAGVLHRQPGRHPPDPPGHPHHEELVQPAGEDGLEPDPLQQRHVLVLGQLEHPLAEPQPALLPVQVAAGRQLGLVRAAAPDDTVPPPRSPRPVRPHPAPRSRRSAARRITGPPARGLAPGRARAGPAPAPAAGGRLTAAPLRRPGPGPRRRLSVPPGSLERRLLLALPAAARSALPAVADAPSASRSRPVRPFPCPYCLHGSRTAKICTSQRW